MNTAPNTNNHCSFCQLCRQALSTLETELTQFRDELEESMNLLVNYLDSHEWINTTEHNDTQLEELRYEMNAVSNIYLFVQKRLSYYRYLLQFHRLINHTHE